jgi:hypothetical protein
MTLASPSASVLDTVATWPGVSTRATRRGAVAVMFRSRAGPRSPGSWHARLPLSEHLRADVLRGGRAKEWFSDWVSKPLGSEADAQDGIALLRPGYDELRPR